MGMLGGVDTGGFSEASKAAMMDSDYFNKRKSSNPFSRGFNFLQDQISKLNKKDDDDDSFILRDYNEQVQVDQELLENFMQTHTYNYEDFNNQLNFD